MLLQLLRSNYIIKYNRTYFNTILIKYSTNFSGNSNLNFTEQFTKEQTSKILETINESSDLSNYNISIQRAKQITAWKNRNGTFSQIEQLVEINGFGVKTLDKFLQSILNPSGEKLKSQQTKRNSNIVIPTINDAKLATIKTIVGLHIGIRSICWSRLEIHHAQSTEVTHWHILELDDKKRHLSDLIKVVSDIIDKIPEADVYILENPRVAQSGAPGTPVQVNVNVELSQVICMISLGLSKRQPTVCELVHSKEDDGEMKKVIDKNQVYYLRQYLAARLFNTFVGNERISTESVISKILSPSIKDQPQPEANISVNSNLIKDYQLAEGYRKEYMGQSLLFALTFLRLCILKYRDNKKLEK